MSCAGSLWSVINFFYRNEFLFHDFNKDYSNQLKAVVTLFYYFIFLLEADKAAVSSLTTCACMVVTFLGSILPRSRFKFFQHCF